MVLGVFVANEKKCLSKYKTYLVPIEWGEGMCNGYRRKIWTPKNNAVIILIFEYWDFTTELGIQKMQTEWKQCRPSLILGYTVCEDLSVWKLKNHYGVHCGT